MPGAHRDGDARYCGATTTTTGQGSVFANGQLWAVENDPNTHGAGGLVSTVGSSVFIEGKKVIVFGDTAVMDLIGHPPPLDDPQGKSGDVIAYG